MAIAQPINRTVLNCRPRIFTLDSLGPDASALEVHVDLVVAPVAARIEVPLRERAGDSAVENAARIRVDDLDVLDLPGAVDGHTRAHVALLGTDGGGFMGELGLHAGDDLGLIGRERGG